jgi:hypothetical protein
MKLLRPFAVTDANLTSSIAETDATEYAAGGTYDLGVNVMNTTGVSPTHHVYESLVEGNTGNALTDTTKWLDLGATNRFAMFDQNNGSSTTGAEIDVSVAVTGRVDGLALLNLSAETVTVTASMPSLPHTNMVLYSDAHTNAAWTQSNVSVTENAVTGPDGTLSGDVITGNGSVGSYISQYVATGASAFTICHEIAPGTATAAHIADINMATLASFDLATGVATLVGGTACGITALANGYYQCWVTYSPGLSTAFGVVGPGATYPSTTTGSIYLGHSQYEETGLPTANITTTTAAVTSSSSALYTRTTSLQSDSGVDSWYAYFSEDVVYQTDLILTDLPLYTSPTISVAITGTGTVSCGTMVLGQLRELGASIYGARAGIMDFSRKETDEFGNYTIVPRSFSKRTTLKLVSANTSIDALYNLLSEYRTTPAVWIGTDTYSCTWIFGFYRDFSIEIAQPENSYLSIDIEGLT